jgi:hypothetical protein
MQIIEQITRGVLRLHLEPRGNETCGAYGIFHFFFELPKELTNEKHIAGRATAQ